MSNPSDTNTHTTNLRGRNPNFDPPRKVTLSIPESLYARLVVSVIAPETGCPKKGAMSQVVSLTLDELFKSLASGESQCDISTVRDYIRSINGGFSVSGGIDNLPGG